MKNKVKNWVGILAERENSKERIKEKCFVLEYSFISLSQCFFISRMCTNKKLVAKSSTFDLSSFSKQNYPQLTSVKVYANTDGEIKASPI